MVALDLGGKLIYCNPAAERVLGYRAAELIELWGNVGHPCARRERAAGGGDAEALPRGPAGGVYARRAHVCLSCSACACWLPAWCPALTPRCAAETACRFPVTLHISALRDALGELTGMVAVAVDQSENLNREQAQRESQERYRDLFEHSTEMIATLSPAGQFLYANPAWKRCFGMEQTALLDLRSFEELFSEGIRSRGGGAIPPRARWRVG